MGVLNLTSDSFYSGSRVPDERNYLKKAEQMLNEGAAILDIGGQSTRPKANLLSAKEEKSRVLPAIDAILKSFPKAVISIDTFYAKTACASIEHGAVIVNDISAGEMDKEMIPSVAGLKVPYIAMHMQGAPANMQDNPHYENVVREVLDFFIKKTDECRQSGIQDIIVDPGFGFGKTLSHNYTLLKHLSVFNILELPVMAGVSRKSMIWRLLEITPEEALSGTTALHLLALQQGANILRVHDVKPAIEAIKIWEYYRQQN
ncbi:MAG: dihydropteroate synthase [Chitinophagaceae bacterium]